MSPTICATGQIVRSGQDDLYDVVDIAASDLSFAAWRADGHVVTWGNRSNGGDSLAVQMQLTSLGSQKHG